MPSPKPGYHDNHYVPQWYQKRFVPVGQVDQELFYLDLKPTPFVDPRGVPHVRKNPRRLGFRYCFFETDLYTTRLGNIESTEVERRFFGAIDREGRKAVDYFASFSHPWNGERPFQEILRYMSTQKLRTPKGLAWLGEKAETKDKDGILGLMLRLQNLYGSIWAESIWLIADAAHSETKFIVSDHPVTVYNRRCGPRSQWCRGYEDPDIRLHGTHTIFPLNLEKILILTNLSWVRNPYQSETGMRPNPFPFRDTVINILDIQTLRHLNEQEVREINFIIKSRASRYIGAAREEWLYPERHVTKSDWHRYGDGYLLMPDPRAVRYGGEMTAFFRDGSFTSIDEFGRRPWNEGFSGARKGVGADWNTFHRFQGEFAKMFGPCRRGRSFNLTQLDNECDSDDMHEYHLELYAKHKGRA